MKRQLFSAILLLWAAAPSANAEEETNLAQWMPALRTSSGISGVMRSTYPPAPYRPVDQKTVDALEVLVSSLKSFKWAVPTFRALSSDYPTVASPEARYGLIKPLLEDHVHAERLLTDALQAEQSLADVDEAATDLHGALLLQGELVDRALEAAPEKRADVWKSHFKAKDEIYLAAFFDPELRKKRLTEERLHDVLAGYKSRDLYADALAWKEPWLKVRHYFSSEAPPRLVYPAPAFALEEMVTGRELVRIDPNGNMVFKDRRDTIRHFPMPETEFGQLDLEEVKGNLAGGQSRLEELAATATGILSDSPAQGMRDALKAQARLLMDHLPALEADLKGHGAALEVDLGALEAQMSALQEAISGGEAEIGRLDEALGENRATLAATRAELDGAKTALTALELETLEIVRSIREVYVEPEQPAGDATGSHDAGAAGGPNDARIAELEAEIAALTRDRQQASEELDRLKTGIAEAKAEFETKKTALESAREELDRARRERVDIQQKITDLYDAEIDPDLPPADAVRAQRRRSQEVRKLRQQALQKQSAITTMREAEQMDRQSLQKVLVGLAEDMNRRQLKIDEVQKTDIALAERQGTLERLTRVNLMRKDLAEKASKTNETRRAVEALQTEIGRISERVTSRVAERDVAVEAVRLKKLELLERTAQGAALEERMERVAAMTLDVEEHIALLGRWTTE